MAEDHLKRSASFGSRRRDDPSFEEDPLIELARIVAEDGGFRRHRTPELRPARNEPGAYPSPARDEAIANQLEAELMQEWERATGEARPPEAPHAPAPQQRFPEIVIEDARPVRTAFGGAQHRDWSSEARPPREEAPEPFEQELDALFADAETSRAADAAHGPAEEGGGAVSLPQYEDNYADSYSAEVAEVAEVDDYADPPDFDSESHPEDYHEEDAPALAPERYQPERRGRSYKGLIAAVGVAGIAILGGAAAAIVGGFGGQSDSGPPPVISAEAGPAKVEPEGGDTAQAGSTAGQAVYDRVAGQVPKDEEKLVERTEEPQQVSRVVLPGAGATQQSDGALSGERPGDAAAEPNGSSAQERIGGQISSETPSMLNGPRIDPVGPRRVRTVTVRPDGSIASTPDPVPVAEAASQPLAETLADFDGADAPDPVPVRTVTIGGGGQEPSRSLQSEPAAPQPLEGLIDSLQPPAPAAAGEPVGEEAAAAPPAEEQVAMLPRARPDQVPEAFTRPAAAPRSEPQQAAPSPAATSRGGQPVDLLAAGPAAPRTQAQPSQPVQQAATPAAPSASSAFAVQLSAQRSEDQARATFASLRNRFPSILGDQQPQIVRADLGADGIFYRVRVGADSQAEAAQLCQRLQAAGGTCFVTR
jgi:hypothetical protein